MFRGPRTVTKKHLLQSGNPSIASCSISIAFISLKIFSERGAMVKFKSLALAGSFPKFSAVALGTLIYSLFSLVEGVGLMFRISWAGWLAIGESAFFIPIEVYELVHKFTQPVFFILIANIFIVWYLFQNRERLWHQRQK